MNNRNSTSKSKSLSDSSVSSASTESTIADINDGDNNSTSDGIITGDINNKTRKKREELSVSATKSIKKEKVEIVVNFS